MMPNNETATHILPEICDEDFDRIVAERDDPPIHSPETIRGNEMYRKLMGMKPHHNDKRLINFAYRPGGTDPGGR